MADPVNVALYSFLSQVWAYNETSGSQATVSRLQNIEMTGNYPNRGYYEIGRKGKIGTTRDPAEYRVTLEQNLFESLQLDYILSGKPIAPSGAQTWNLGDLLTYAGKYRLYVLNRNQDLTLMNEKEINGCSVAEISWRFSIDGAIGQMVSFVGRGGKLYKAASTVHTWGAQNDTDSGGIHGKEARIWLGTSGSGAADRAFRLQSFNIRATFPSVIVKELGRRASVGTLNDVPEVSVDFELLAADDQPSALFFRDQTTYYDLDDPVTPIDAYVRIFDPDLSEAASVIKSFKIENVTPSTHAPIRSQVRGLSTIRYGLISNNEDTADSGGIIISNRNQ